MKKFLAICLLLSIISACGCSNVNTNSGSTISSSAEAGEQQGTENVNTEDTANSTTESISFSESDLETMAINSDKSNYQNSINNKSEIPGKMCYVEETDTFFYSTNTALYQKTGDTTIKLLDSAAYAINIAEGYLYYIIPGGTSLLASGKAYRMRLSDGKTECIIDKASNLSVYPDGLFYIINTEKDLGDGSFSVAATNMRCDFDGANSEERTDSCFATDNYLSPIFDDGKIKLVNLKDGTSKEICEEEENASNISISGDKIYYIRTNFDTAMNAVVEVDINTGEAITYSPAVETYFSDYTVCNGKLYLFDGFFYIAENAKMKKYNVIGESLYESLCVCGDKIYGVCSSGAIYELSFDDGNGIAAVNGTEFGVTK